MSTILPTETREFITSATPELPDLLSVLERAYDHRSWHGTNLRGSIRGLTPRQAAWRPAPGRHNIWELIVHSAYWKYVARRRITGDRRRSFPLDGSNWFERPVLGRGDRAIVRGVRLPPSPGSGETRRGAERGGGQADQLRIDIALLASEHLALLDAVARLPPRRLHKKIGKSRDTYVALIAGVAAHDLYHAGQIQLLKRLMS